MPPSCPPKCRSRSFLESGAAVVAVGRFTFTLFIFTMLRLTSMKDGQQKEHDVNQRHDLDTRSALSEGSFESSFTGMGCFRSGDARQSFTFLRLMVRYVGHVPEACNEFTFHVFTFHAFPRVPVAGSASCFRPAISPLANSSRSWP